MKLTENNRALKVLALVIAIVLWLYVSVEQDPLSQRSYNVPVTVENLSADKIATLTKETVRIEVMGRDSRLDAVTAEDFKAYVDLKNVKTGEGEADVKLSLPSEVYFAKVEPKTVRVFVDRREGETMSVDVVRTGMLPDGVSIDALTVEPQNVFVSGNEEALEAVAKAGVELDLSDVYADTKKEFTVRLFDYEGNIIESSELKAYPEKVTLDIKARAVDVQKTVPIQAELTGSLADGIQVDSVTVEPATAIVEGSPETVAKIKEVKTEPIDLSKIKETTSFNVKLVGKHLQQEQRVAVTIHVSAEAGDVDEGDSYTKVVPIAVTGSAAESVSASTLLAEVTYHMQPGYADAGDNLTAFVQINAVPEGSIEAQVQFGVVEGLVIDYVTPERITLNSIY